MENQDKNKLEFGLVEFQEAINTFCDLNNIDDLKNESQLVFNACMQWINMTIIAPARMLKNGNSNTHNLFKVYQLAMLYKYICNLYNKLCSIDNFEFISNISVATIYDWKNYKHNNTVYNELDDDNIIDIDGVKVSSLSVEIYKILTTSEKTGLEGLLLSSKNPVGVLAMLNHKHGYAHEKPVEVETVEAVEVEQIAAKYGLLEG